MPPRGLTAEDIADWLTPGQAVKLLDAVFQKSYLVVREELPSH